MLCATADIFLDLKGKDNKKSGKYGFIDSNWTEMLEWRFQLSIILAMFAVPMYALGMISLGNQMGGVTGFIMKLTAIVGAMGGFFIHSVLCLFPVIYKAVSDKQIGQNAINKIYDTIMLPFYLLYQNNSISKQKILELMETPEEVVSREPLNTATHEITFRNVSFSYVQGEPILKNVSFIAPDRELTAIVGESGSGKSTILNLITKYYVADDGTISIGGKPINCKFAEAKKDSSNDCSYAVNCEKCKSDYSCFGRRNCRVRNSRRTVSKGRQIFRYVECGTKAFYL